jgi:hypothetical protein
MGDVGSAGSFILRFGELALLFDFERVDVFAIDVVALNTWGV